MDKNLIDKKDDNRNIIKLDELDDEELRKYLDKYKDRIPAIILDDLYNKLKGRGVTKEQVDRIIKKIEDRLETSKIMDHLLKKVDSVESMLKKGEEEKRVEYIHVPRQVEKSEARLESIPNDPKSIMILLKWIEFMIERVGHDGLEDVLNYYVDINWINDKVMYTILKYAKGIKLYHENSDWRPIGYMSVQDHITSLLFIEALRTGKFNRDLILEVDREIARIKKEVSEIHGI